MIVLVFPILAKVCVSESVQIILENDCGNDWGRTIVVQGLFNLRNEVGIRLVSFHCIPDTRYTQRERERDGR